MKDARPDTTQSTVTKDVSAVVEDDALNVTDGGAAAQDNGVVSQAGGDLQTGGNRSGGDLQTGGINLDGVEIGDNSSGQFSFETVDDEIAKAAIASSEASAAAAVAAAGKAGSEVLKAIDSVNKVSQEKFSSVVDAINEIGGGAKSSKFSALLLGFTALVVGAFVFFRKGNK